MIAISSYAPFDRALEVTRNQMVAKESWEPLFPKILYFGPPVAELGSPKTWFFATERPTIRQMVEAASLERGFAALINADIVLSPKFAQLEAALSLQGFACAISTRREFDADVRPIAGQRVDWGLDIFVAEQAIWLLALKEVPREFQIGKQLWDTWMLAFFMLRSGGRCGDFSDAGLIWHPRHANRGDFAMKKPVDDPYLDRVRWPKRKVLL